MQTQLEICLLSNSYHNNMKCDDVYPTNRGGGRGEVLAKQLQCCAAGLSGLSCSDVGQTWHHIHVGTLHEARCVFASF